MKSRCLTEMSVTCFTCRIVLYLSQLMAFQQQRSGICYKILRHFLHIIDYIKFGTNLKKFILFSTNLNFQPIYSQQLCPHQFHLKFWTNLKKFFLFSTNLNFQPMYSQQLCPHHLYCCILSCLATCKKALAFLFRKDSVVSCMTFKRI